MIDNFNSVKEVYEGYNNLEEKFFYIAIIKQDKIDLTELREILIHHIDLVESKDSEGANLRRLFRIYDYLAFAETIKVLIVLIVFIAII